ncbi:ABC transporter ATP-binding protein [Acidocella sp.]|uniref:ABC transporter ATP-binding protein n=1 Tax=Acidocella sp. TaxID=50710 RepID=UPI003D057B44
MVGVAGAHGVKRIEIDYVLTVPVALRACFTVQGFTALLGRSGAGKTTLLRALAGLAPARGEPWQGLAPERRPIGYLPQQTLLFPHLNVLENTAYALKGRRRLEQAGTLLAELGLAALASRRADQLSGGQAKRIALARALAHGAELLLLDEPSVGLDSVTRDATLDWLVETATARGIPMLAATHDHEVATRAERLALLADGRIIQHGPAREVFSAPMGHAAATLLGYENIFERGDEVWAIRARDIRLDPAGERFSVLRVRELGTSLRLVCGPAPRLTVELPHGRAHDYPPGREIRLCLAAAARVEPASGT